MTAAKLSDVMGGKSGNIQAIFRYQAEHFWDFDWAAVRLLGTEDEKIIGELLAKVIYANPIDVAKKFATMTEYGNDGKGQLYAVTHSLAQATLASGKMRRSTRRPEQQGEKCHLCASFEVLRAPKEGKWNDTREYTAAIRSFWDVLRNNWDGSPYDFNEHEKLCAMCLTKRMACKVMRGNMGHILSSVLGDGARFESTTELALHDYFHRAGISDRTRRREIAQNLHNQSITADVTRIDGVKERLGNRDVYYAILIMDGDKMGQLVNGRTIPAKWEDVMHPELVTRLKKPGFDKSFAAPWGNLFGQQRLLTPAVHSAISEALGNFAFYGVAPIIEKNNGQLIYAGGDDVCAVMPISTALSAAREIREFYISSFRTVTKGDDGNINSLVTNDNWSPQDGFLALGLGQGKDIDISAGILICHHKESLSHMIERAHTLLKNKAKIDCERGACAIELRKRSGGSRYFARKWNDPAWDAFASISALIGSVGTERISTSLVYRLQKFSDGIATIVKDGGDTASDLEKFIRRQLDRSLVPEGKLDELAAKMTRVVWSGDGRQVFKSEHLEGLIVAAFLPSVSEEIGG